MTPAPLSSAVLISMLQRLTREGLARCGCPECLAALRAQEEQRDPRPR